MEKNTKIFILFLLSNLLLNYDTGVIPASLLEIEKEINFDYKEQALLGSLVYLGLSTASLFVSPIISKFGAKDVCAFVLLLNSLCCFIFSLSFEKIILFSTRFLMGVTESFVVIYSPVWINNYSPKDKGTTWLGLLHATTIFGMIAGYIVSGIVINFLSDYFNEIVAIEIEKGTYDCAKENLADFDNIQVVHSDVLNYDFTKKADLIVCEMMDTALIDEEEIPVLNHVRQFLKNDGKIIPQGVINSAELVNMQREYIHWDENAKYEAMSRPVIYSEFNFLEDINPDFEAEILFKAVSDGIINGLKITTFTKLNDNLICGPTPMLNPPLLIPLEEKFVKGNDLIKVKLKYIMGNGIESIKSEII
jgi:predicted RNA methylase